MSQRSVFLATYDRSSRRRAHFAIFIPNANEDHPNLRHDFRAAPCLGTIIQVVGEPLMSGYHLEIKRNYEGSSDLRLQQLVFLGHVDESHLHQPRSDKYILGDSPKGRFETEATKVPPPPHRQNPRAPIDGVTSKRCQEWTMEYLTRLVEQGLISAEALSIAQEQRDPPNHGIIA